MGVAALGFWLALTLTGVASADTAPAPEAVSPPATETASPEAVVQAIYSVISGPAGPRDWAHLRGLMAPGAQFIVAGARPGQPARARYLAVEEYVTGSGKAMATQGFYEHGAIGPIWRYGHIATVTSPYESRHAPGEKPFARGINHFQLINDGARWWVVSIYWEGESPAYPLPPEADALLKAAN